MSLLRGHLIIYQKFWFTGLFNKGNNSIMLEYLKKYNTLPSSPGIADLKFDLQRFGAEDEGRTEEPTEKKLREAREKGQVARTQELPQTMVVIFGFFVIFIFGSWYYETIESILRYYLSSFSRFELTEKSVLHDMYFLITQTGKILLPVFAIACIAAVIGNVAQVGFQVSTHPLKFDLKKLKFDPATVLKKIFLSKEVAMNLFKSIFKVTAIGLVAYLIVASDFDMILKTPDFSISQAFSEICTSGFKIIIWTSVLLLVLSIPDYFFQKQQFIDSLKMTKEEIKEELKETMGDPYLRARLREMQREIAMKNMITEVPKADVVITNPTHYAVALQYEKESMEAPTVIAKGADSLALKIREIARENFIPIIENKPLARQMYSDVDVGDIIPEDLFYAVSLVYAELYKKKQYKRAI